MACLASDVPFALIYLPFHRRGDEQHSFLCRPYGAQACFPSFPTPTASLATLARLRVGLTVSRLRRCTPARGRGLMAAGCIFSGGAERRRRTGGTSAKARFLHTRLRGPKGPASTQKTPRMHGCKQLNLKAK